MEMTMVVVIVGIVASIFAFWGIQKVIKCILEVLEDIGRRGEE